MAIHVVGSSGYIGRRLVERIPSDETVVLYSRNDKEAGVHLDFEDLSRFDYSDLKKDDYIIFLMAISSPDQCNNNYDYAYKVNVTNTKIFIHRCLEKGCKVLFFSSDVVYGNRAGKHNENSRLEPFGNYGKMKCEIEEEFRAEPCFKVFRLSYVFSKEDKFFKYLRSASENKFEPDVYDSLYRNVVYIEDVIEGALKLGQTFDTWNNKVFNLSGPDLLSRKDLAQLYKEIVDENLSYTVSRPSEEFLQNRPESIEVESLYLAELLGRAVTEIGRAISMEFK